MNLQVLVSTMHQNDHSIIEKMNIKSDVIVINQCDKNDFEEFEVNNNKVKFLSFSERGVGLSRNNALMRATAEICLFADDDVVYRNDYKDIILRAFEENPKADVMVFNLTSDETGGRSTAMVNKNRKVNWFNSLKYGACRVAIRIDSIREKNIVFSLLFGGGAKYSAGEDVLFITDCLKKRLRIYSVESIIGHVSHEKSSWFNGYTDKFFYDKGVLFSAISPTWSKLLCLQFAIRKRRVFKEDKSIKEALKLMIKGTAEFKK